MIPDIGPPTCSYSGSSGSSPPVPCVTSGNDKEDRTAGEWSRAVYAASFKYCWPPVVPCWDAELLNCILYCCPAAVAHCCAWVNPCKLDNLRAAVREAGEDVGGSKHRASRPSTVSHPASASDVRLSTSVIALSAAPANPPAPARRDAASAAAAAAPTASHDPGAHAPAACYKSRAWLKVNPLIDGPDILEDT
jgi:hypothetical protein